MCQVCGTILTNDSGVTPTDDNGCRLPSGHAGPHEFIAKDGLTYQWETDWECDCEHCRSGDGDYCTVYWTASEFRPTKSAQQKPIDPSQMALF
jgi:hypothetical protein